jgi:D-beta-D-heptose 7-phosphate kinase/D-beta-D-heptose 1-phosphate adenosyltransferase
VTARLPALTSARARALASGFPAATVLVVGDVMLDQFLVGRVTRISPEAPVPIVQFEREENRIGGAANVAHNIVALGARASIVGLVGDDDQAGVLRDALAARGVDTSGLVVDRARPTTRKVRVVTDRHQQVARVDYERDAEAPQEVEEALVARARELAASAGAIVVSDYLKGAVTARVVAELGTVARARGVPLLVDPKIPHIGYYAGATLVTPNHHEAEIAAHMRIRTDEDARLAARAFRERAGCEGVLITRGEHGMWLLDAATEGALPATAREVADVTGAGDTVIATLALALAAGATTAEAATLANLAAGVVVGKFGPATVTVEELLSEVPGTVRNG